MCTVTIIPHGQGIRLACNRDELRSRPAGLPPRVVSSAARQALMPIDPLSGGTWIAASHAGLVFTLLNVHALPKDDGTRLPRRSRGAIIPHLLDAPTLEEALAQTQALNADDFAPFRLLMADRRSFAEFYSTGQTCLRTAPTRQHGPLLFTSSGLGDAVVEQPRRALFDEFFAAGRDWREMQDAYHRHAWPERRHLSVCMQRSDARTVSCTIVELDAWRVRMAYYPDAPDQSVQPIFASMDLVNNPDDTIG